MDTANTKQEKRIALVRDNPYSGNVTLSFLHNDLEVRADFIPPTGAGMHLTADIVLGFLARQGVVYGIRENAVQKAVEESAARNKPVKYVLIARGDPPDDEIPEYFEVNKQLFLRQSPPDPKLRIDYRASSPFVIVKKGQILAYKHPKVSGKEGKNVKGASIPYKRRVPEGVSGGTNTKTDDKYITAEINGQFLQDKQIVYVDEQLVIKEGVGYKTGNISFPGNVRIEGPVCEGFKIYAEGSVTITQTLDLTEVITRGDLAVAGGIIGHGQAIAKVRGSIKAKFIENCHITCLKTIHVERAIINSAMYTMDTIDLGDKGFIISGDITAVHGVRAAKIGKAAGRGAKLHCGIDFTVQQELEKVNQQFQFISAKLEKIERFAAQAETRAEKRIKLEELGGRLKEEHYSLKDRISDLVKRINADENAAVEVYGEIATGTLIEICQVALFVSEPLKKTRVRLDKFYNRLVAEPL
ncbi:MAG: FapA family protein [Spirochaetaceae bacterium]|jgi:uncharacterized protein (DUF342 family)|nr:FapA family protein [Spirochaetaceae bacterium]